MAENYVIFILISVSLFGIGLVIYAYLTDKKYKHSH